MASRPTRFGPDLLRVWFPIALIVLLIVAIPGVVLFVLTLLGRQTVVNDWLQQNYSITYHHFLTWWAALLLLLVPFFIILLYFLKLKRRALQVPSTFLWRKSIEDLHVNSLFQWLRENVLLLLQVLIVLAIIYAVMAFQLHGRSAESHHYILMIDNSASMAAHDDPDDNTRTRLDRAKDAAIAEIDAHADTDYGMVIVFNSSAEILLSYTNDQALLHRTIKDIPQSHQQTRIDEALRLADSLANPNRPMDAEAGVATEGVATSVHLYSDGRFPDVAEFGLRGNLNFEYHPIGEPGPPNNVGLVALNATRDERDSSKLQVFARVANYRRDPVDLKVRLETTINGRSVGLNEEPLTLEGRKPDGDAGRGAEGIVTFDLVDVSDKANTVLRASLVHGGDHFDLDDEAWLVVGVVRKARVLIVSSLKGYRLRAQTVRLLQLEDGVSQTEAQKLIPLIGKLFGAEKDFLDAAALMGREAAEKHRPALLRRGAMRNDALQSFFDQVTTARVARVEYLNPDDLKDDAKYLKPARDGAWDLVIFDRVCPTKKEDLPLANAWYIDCLPPPWKKDGLPLLKNPAVRMNKHSLFRDMSFLQEISVIEAFRFDMTHTDVPPRTPRLLETDNNGGLLFMLTRQSFADLVMTFALFRSPEEPMTDWILHLGFPTFLRNVLYELGTVIDGASEETVRPGKFKSLRPDVPVKEIVVEGPGDGAKETVRRGSGTEFIFGKTGQLGIYKVSWDGKVQRSFAVNLLDAEESNLQPRPKFRLGADEVEAGAMRAQPRDLWKWLALGALGLLLLEWYVYNRRVHV